MFNYRRVELNKKEVNQFRMTMTDCEVMAKYKTSRENLISQCWKRKEEWLPFVQNNRPKHRPKKQANPWPRMTRLIEKQVEKKELVTESWADDTRTAKHNISIPDWFELVEVGMKPCRAFYDKLNS